MSDRGSSSNNGNHVWDNRSFKDRISLNPLLKAGISFSLLNRSGPQSSVNSMLNLSESKAHIMSLTLCHPRLGLRLLGQEKNEPGEWRPGVKVVLLKPELSLHPGGALSEPAWNEK